MRIPSLLTTVFLLVPAVTHAAENVERCLTLGRKLAATPSTVGAPDTGRGFPQLLAAQNREIRNVRLEMQELRCRTGSIVTFQNGAPDPCIALNDALSAMETNRRAMIARRQGQMSVVSAPQRSEDDIRAEMLSLRCGEIDYAAVEQERLAPRPAVLPQVPSTPSAIPGAGLSGSSSILSLQSKIEPLQAARPQGPPERDWDPSKPVRMVGPMFFPDEKIDLAHPKMPGAQPTQ
ncbi:hypothetical protein J2858_002276 [Neorhizobium galegae]|uniref:hypothetical protein n=1 Tax=Rhizobium/Agrobacterium group TaxID=227290 RepID=UPI001AE588F7|nr:hypothetical protein [Neorhizobium galegae]MBP2549353.1 hypothetical protein [Neorhizobium galegae]